MSEIVPIRQLDPLTVDTSDLGGSGQTFLISSVAFGIFEWGSGRLVSGGSGMTNEHSVSRWLDGIKAGDEASIERLWHRYFERLVRLARGKLPGHCRRAYDEEDVALSAFQSFCQRAAGGKFPQAERSK